MRRLGPTLVIILTAALLSAAVVYAGAGEVRAAPAAGVVPLKDAKLNIEDANDEDTGF
jgi:hypothetical protein